MLCKVQWSGFPIIANLFKGKLLHCEGVSSRGGCSGRLAGHGMQRLSWSSHLPEAFRGLSSTCRAAPPSRRRKRQRLGFSPSSSSVHPPGCQAACRSCHRLKPGSAVEAGSSAEFQIITSLALVSVTFSPVFMALVRMCRRAFISISRSHQLQADDLYDHMIYMLAMFWQAIKGNSCAHLMEHLLHAFVMQLKSWNVWLS